MDYVSRGAAQVNTAGAADRLGVQRRNGPQCPINTAGPQPVTKRTEGRLDIKLVDGGDPGIACVAGSGAGPR
jgi:hypothetical protein